jgi:hypothetical protein
LRTSIGVTRPGKEMVLDMPGRKTPACDSRRKITRILWGSALISRYGRRLRDYRNPRGTYERQNKIYAQNIYI